MVSKILLIFAGLVIGLSPLFGLSIDRGQLRLVVDEKNGRMSLYEIKNTEPPAYLPLFVTSDPTTSQWRLLINNKMVVLGDSSQFTTGVEPIDGGAKVTWTSKALVATLRLQFLESEGATDVDGLRLDLDLANQGTDAIPVGVRWLLDTNLGEKKNHFQLPDGTYINSEQGLSKPYPEYWSSNSPTDNDLGLRVSLGDDATPPESVVFANWKRLVDAPWDFVPKTGREFSLLPYSFNDSAVVQFYGVQNLDPQATRRITTELALKTANSLSGARLVGANALDTLLSQTRDPALSGVDQDLASVDLLLKQIDTNLKNPAQTSADDLRLLQVALDQIEARTKAVPAKPSS